MRVCTSGPQPGAFYTQEQERVTNFPNWSSPGWNGGGQNGGARPGWEGNPPVINSAGMSPCYVDAVGGPFKRFTPPVGHGPFRTRTVTVAPVGVKLAEDANFSTRMSEWSDVKWGVVQSMHWWHNVQCDGPISGEDATGTVDCTSVASGTWPGKSTDHHHLNLSCTHCLCLRVYVSTDAQLSLTVPASYLS
jgi:hypothetical protein